MKVRARLTETESSVCEGNWLLGQHPLGAVHYLSEQSVVELHLERVGCRSQSVGRLATKALDVPE